MIRIILTAIGIVMGYLLQSTVLPQLAGVFPDVLIILVVAAGYTRGQMAGMMTGLFSGLLLDCSVGSIVGLYAAFYLLIGYLIGFSNKVYDRDDYIMPITFIGLSEFVYNNLYYVINFLLRGRLDYGYYLGRIMLPRTIYTLAVGIVLYKFYHSIHHFLLRLEQKEE